LLRFSCGGGHDARKPCAVAKIQRRPAQPFRSRFTYIPAFVQVIGSSRLRQALAGSLQRAFPNTMSSPLQTRSNKVLLVDGDFRTSQRLAGLLRDDGFDVEVLRDGATAIARLTRAPLPDTLITELKLPLCDGTAVVRFGRAQHAGLKVVVLTGYPNLLVPEALSGPAPHVLTKPLDYVRLLDVLKEQDCAEQEGAAASSARRSA
jgi:CheY-like chemotaxis protein